MSLLSRWHPLENLWGEMSRFQREMDDLFNRFGFESRRPAYAVSYPALNMWEDADYVYAEAELPGLNLDELEICVTGSDQLTIKGTRQPPRQGEGVWHRQERGFGTFTRVITLPVDVDPDKVEARLEHGVLTIKMAKGETAKPRKIAVKAE